jgi:hypothetical protein
MEKCWDANTGCNQFLTWRGAGQLYHYRAVIAEMMSDLISRPPTLSIRHPSSSHLDVCYDGVYFFKRQIGTITLLVCGKW